MHTEAEQPIASSEPYPIPPPAVRQSAAQALREIAVDELWQHRELLLQLTLRDVRIRYKQAVMGFAWAILMPALIVAAGALVRYAMAYVGGSTVSNTEIAGIAVKALPWAFFVGALGFAVNSLSGNAMLVTKIYFPREALPLAAVLAQAFDTLIGALAVLVLLPLLGVGGSWTQLWVIPLAVLLLLLTIGVSLLVSCANLFFRDVKYIVQVLLTFGIFFTPVFFEPAMFGATGSTIMMLNPLAPLLEGLRLSVVEGHHLLQPLASADGLQLWAPWMLGYSALWAAAAGIGGALIFHRAEHVFAEFA